MKRGIKTTLSISLFCLMLTAQTHSAAAFFQNYSQWAAHHEDARVAYLTGAFDTFVSLASGPDGLALVQHTRKCVLDAKMNNIQLTKNVVAYASTKPELHGDPVVRALINYLFKLCGPLKPKQ